MGASYGWDTDNYIYNVAQRARGQFGVGAFWIRYMNPSPVATYLMTSSSATLELRAAWDWGARYLAPNTEPSQSRLWGSAAMGAADGQAFCAALVSIYDAIAPLFIQSSKHVDCYLSLENNTNMSTAYWQGWANAVGQYWIDGSQPLYPGMYCNPASPALNCSQVGAYYCYSLWSAEPEPCNACNPFTIQGWAAYNCYNAPGSVAYSTVWQMAEQDVCNHCRGVTSWPNVDADMTNPNDTETSYMLWLAERP